MNYAKIRKAFIDFFASKNHHEVESSSLIPYNDPTLMFTNAGMNQFKDVFLGADRRDYKRAVTIQKCLRAGGKHNDLENVGFTARHHTFFEMMGNFSFGDYFKQEAIAFAWEFLTETLNIPKERLYVTVFTTDDEAAEIWEKHIGVPKEKIFRYGEKDNFWRMGQTGPCGPCSEIFYDHKPDQPAVPIDQDEDRFVEIWNLVFMQFFEDENGKQTPLPKPSVDTGAGIERLAAVMQGVSDNYQTDVFQPLLAKACELAGQKSDWASLSKDPELMGAVKVVADHARAATFLIGEGVLPSNEGAGYVLRRIMRRAIRYGRKLNESASVYPAVCETVVDLMSPHYPVLTKKKDFILSAVRDEEKRFLQTLDHGSQILQDKIVEIKKAKKTEIDGTTAFTLYDTYGFPFDLTQLIAKEQSLSVDEAGFKADMEKAKDKARAARKVQGASSDDRFLNEWTQKLPDTDFVGYDQLSQEAKLLAISDGSQALDSLSDEGWLVFQSTPFYAEGGGQVADQGSIYSRDGNLLGQIIDCRKANDTFMHYVKLNDGASLSQEQSYLLKVNSTLRQSTANNHSATHLLNAALQQVLGDHVNQAGSLVNDGKLRFDFSHNKPLSPEQITGIETLVNQQISQGFPVGVSLMGQKEAVAAGATAMFGEKYGDTVRVVSMGEQDGGKAFSMELCGGTHVSNTAQIQLFKVMSETGVAAGVRRIEALTGQRALQFLNQMTDENIRLCEQLKVKKPKIDDETFGGGLSQRVDDLQKKIKKLEQDLKKKASQSVSVNDLMKDAEEKDLAGEKGLTLFTRVETTDRQLLSDIADQVRDKNKAVAMVLIGESEEGAAKPLVVAVSKSLKSLHAGKITKEICGLLGGKGGGRPDFAQGSVTNLDQLNAAKSKFHEMVSQ